jgi:ArsR family transcriptional regulator, arsenate/arsenite/antimonite-responsive transcriptional repressor
VWHNGRMSALRTGDRPQASLPLLTGCCSPVVGRVITSGEAERLAGSLKAIADPVRLRLISLVAAHEDGEACVCDLTEPVGLSQPTVSHHLKILADAGILTRQQRGKWAYYRLVPDSLDAISALAAEPSPAN